MAGSRSRESMRIPDLNEPLPTFSKLADVMKSRENIRRHGMMVDYTALLEERFRNINDTQSAKSSISSVASSISSTKSTKSISSVASSIDRDRSYLNTRIGDMIEYALDTTPIEEDYLKIKTHIKEKKASENESLISTISYAETFIAESKTLDIDNISSEEVEKKITHGKQALSSINDAIDENAKHANKGDLINYLELLKHRVNLSIQTLQVKAWQLQKPSPPSTPLNEQRPDEVDQAVSAVGAAFEIASMLFSNLIASAQIIKRFGTSITEKGTQTIRTNVNNIIDQAEETIIGIMVGPMDPDETKTISTAYTSNLHNKLNTYESDIKNLINYVNQIQEGTNVELNYLYEDIKQPYNNLLAEGNDALFMFMEYIRTHEALDISPDVIAIIIQLLTLNGEFVALQQDETKATETKLHEGKVMKIAQVEVPADESLTPDGSQEVPNTIFGFEPQQKKQKFGVELPTGGRRRTKKRGARRSVKKHQKKPKCVRARKTRRGKSQTKKR